MSTPGSTPSEAGTSAVQSLRDMEIDSKTAEKPIERTEEPAKAKEAEKTASEPLAKPGEQDEPLETKTAKKTCHKTDHKKKKVHRKVPSKKIKTESSGSDSSTDSTEATSESESESSEDEKPVKRKTKSKSTKTSAREKKTAEDKRRRKSIPESELSTCDTASSEDEPAKSKKSKKSKKTKKQAKIESSESSEDETPKSKKSKKPKKTAKLASSDENDSDSDDGVDGADTLQAQFDAIKLAFAAHKAAPSKSRSAKDKEVKIKKSKSKSSRTSNKDYKRVDQLWDSTIHNYTLKPSAEQEDDEYAEHAFLIRRCFNWENKYTDTVVDIKSKQLRAVLQEVMKDCKSVSLEAEEPTFDPNLLFLFLEELRGYYKKTLKAKIKKEKSKKKVKKLEKQRSLLKSLIEYVDEDYKDTKKTLYPLLEAGNITFDLMWALFKPNEIAITSCYGNWDEPRCFRVDYATKCCSMQRGDWYTIEGKYMEYDGKSFGLGDFEIDVDGFKGPRKISSLATYPLRYHKDPERIRKKILERGERFVAMDGMQYKFHKGMAFMKKKKQVAKINVNGRVMVDPATFRRINPNYPISFIKPNDIDELFEISEDEDDDCSCCEEEGEAPAGKQTNSQNADDNAPKYKYKWSKNEEGRPMFLAVEVDEDGDPIRKQRVDVVETSDQKNRKFTEEELLLTSPVVLGFSFSDKLWLEFSISGVKEIEYNDQAFESLVLPDNQKEIVRALVESHKFHAAKTIDDVVQGKGKGLVSVLHGPPGTGKTLTAEGISELLKCPLYMVSAGELGTDPSKLEYELQKILDIAHSWGAVLLLDEADVFLEKREVHDIHRNALVSIFLRLLEYFQGILFLTTNRVDTFDEAFQSRIHLPLRYGDLTTKAKKSVWKIFFEVVRKTDPSSIVEFSDYELDCLSKHMLNGRQIKNAVRTAQALALREAAVMEMRHVKKVLDVSESFERDLKGGTGYEDAMRSYT
ncbi:hypothetical protein LTR86_009269 [Recurvomyces mirabilis]|nr:hypothetical protein LTR86_009269 [Recurvomyces mirabilis]